MRRTVPLVRRRRPRRASCWRPATTSRRARIRRRRRAQSTSSRSSTQSREDVLRLIGTPSAVATFNPNVWYYISARQEYWGLPSRGSPSRASSRSRSTNRAACRPSNTTIWPTRRTSTMVSRITPTVGQGADGARADPGQRRQVQRPAPAEQPGRADNRRSLIRRSCEAKKKPRSCDRGFFVGAGGLPSARARRAAAGPRCW